MDPDAFGKVFRTARAAVGLDGVRLHDLRHGFASMLVAAGTNVRTVADVLGHSTVAFTLSTYVHPDEDAAVTAIDEAQPRVQALMAGTKPQVAAYLGKRRKGR